MGKPLPQWDLLCVSHCVVSPFFSPVFVLSHCGDVATVAVGQPRDLSSRQRQQQGKKRVAKCCGCCCCGIERK